eukprot:5098286-Heterocapsa_arctica.AAC.1
MWDACEGAAGMRLRARTRAQTRSAKKQTPVARSCGVGVGCAVLWRSSWRRLCGLCRRRLCGCGVGVVCAYCGVGCVYCDCTSQLAQPQLVSTSWHFPIGLRPGPRVHGSATK